jgi:hypothetical protein
MAGILMTGSSKVSIQEVSNDVMFIQNFMNIDCQVSTDMIIVE